MKYDKQKVLKYIEEQLKAHPILGKEDECNMPNLSSIIIAAKGTRQKAMKMMEDIELMERHIYARNEGTEEGSKHHLIENIIDHIKQNYVSTATTIKNKRKTKDNDSTKPRSVKTQEN